MKVNVVAQELRRIAAAHRGMLRPADVVKAARPKASPLHSKFEWRDGKAAAAYRLWQARQLISVTVEVIEQISAPVFVSLKKDRKDKQGGYRALATVLSNADHRKLLLADAISDMMAFQEKYSRLKELSDVFAAMRRIINGRQRVKEAA